MAALLVLVAAAPTHAGTPSPYTDDPMPSILGAATGWLLSGGLQLANNERPAGVPDGLDPSAVNPFDRMVIGPARSASAAWSDALLLTLLAAPYVIDAVDVGIDGGPALGYGRDSLVFLEVQGITAAVTQLVKTAASRARPYTYADGFSARSHDDDRSFFSGHTSLAFASAVALGVTYARRHTGTSEGWVWTGLMAGATAVGVLRVHARKHFWTDVLVGAAVGSLIGYVVTSVHARPAPGPNNGSGTTAFQIGFSAAL